jgi:hypothetical protein
MGHPGIRIWSQETQKQDPRESGCKSAIEEDFAQVKVKVPTLFRERRERRMGHSGI